MGTKPPEEKSLHAAVLAGDNDRLRDAMSLGTMPNPSAVAVIAEFLRLLIQEHEKAAAALAEAHRLAALWDDGRRMRILCSVKPKNATEANELADQINEAERLNRECWHANAALVNYQEAELWPRRYAPSLFSCDPPSKNEPLFLCPIRRIVDFATQHGIDIKSVNGWARFGQPLASYAPARRKARIRVAGGTQR